MKIYTRTGDAGETSLFDGTRVSKADAAGRRLRRGRRAERLARPRRAPPASIRDLDDAARSHPARSVRARRAARRSGRAGSPARVDQGVAHRRRRRRGSKQLIDRLEAELPPLRRFILAGGAPAGAALHVARTVCRRAERRIVALAAGGRTPSWSATSTGCPICCSCWRASSTIAPAFPRPSGDRDCGHRAGLHRRVLTASNTARASSCETRSRIAPHSTSTVPVTRLDRDVPAIARDALRPIVEARSAGADRLLARGALDVTAAIGEPLISTRTAAIRSLSIDRSP